MDVSVSHFLGWKSRRARKKQIWASRESGSEKKVGRKVLMFARRKRLGFVRISVISTEEIIQQVTWKMQNSSNYILGGKVLKNCSLRFQVLLFGAERLAQTSTITVFCLVSFSNLHTSGSNQHSGNTGVGASQHLIGFLLVLFARNRQY